jgi:hypothetical protein
VQEVVIIDDEVVQEAVMVEVDEVVDEVGMFRQHQLLQGQLHQKQ